MKMRTVILLLFGLFFLRSNAQTRLSTEAIKTMYKQSDMIFTAFVVYENIMGSTTGEVRMIDFDITEIQKGRDYSRLMVYVDNDTLSFEKGKEYLVFAKMNENTNRYELIFSERVCKSCDNYTIRKIYEIIDKRPFASIKKPREKTPWHERGCGCH